MEYFDFIKPGDLDNLPEDPQLAFSEFVNLAHARLIARLETLNRNVEGDWHLVNDAKHGFSNVVLGAARSFGIEPFASQEVPEVRNFSDDQYKQFRSDLSNYITQIMVSTAKYDRSNSVPLLDTTRQSLNTYIHYLREAVKQSTLPDWKKTKLNKRIEELEKEFERGRVRIVVVASIVMAILAAPGEVVGTYDAVVRITNSIMREIGTAKEADEQQRHISAAPPTALIPPRKAATKPTEVAPPEDEEEIPF